ncbi:LOW QUALITY PROTEIN: hypothetical protein Cgig2_009169 [Carnegiea gigantea]|uniref:Uncharacterized protein n=1 Tax=Carnegiea gigantea TaxID=171969 RepID=A0A9Q1KDY3_9CARY|nr:LOW QUALITY PROTEIN: hypothetical protein Cgig2_009169 [Carnegiea gigantea]
MPRRRKDFALTLGDSSSSMEPGSSSSSDSGSSQYGQGVRHKMAYRKRVTLSKDCLLKFDGKLSWAISDCIKSFYNGKCTCLSNLSPEELQLWWRTFEGQYTWASELIEEVKEGWLNAEEGRERLEAHRNDPKFQKKSIQCLNNRTEGPNVAILHYQGSRKARLLHPLHYLQGAIVRKMLNLERKNIRHLELSTTLKREHKRQRSYNIKFQVDEQSTIYGLGTSAALCYKKPTTSTTSTSSIYIASAYSKLQIDMKLNRRQLDEQKNLVDDQKRQFDEATKLIHSLQTQVNMLFGSSSHLSESHDP